MTNCPRCGEGVAAGQEYCLECGLRLPGAGRVGAAAARRRKTAALIALAGRRRRGRRSSSRDRADPGDGNGARRRDRHRRKRGRRHADRHRDLAARAVAGRQERLDDRPRLGARRSTAATRPSRERSRRARRDCATSASSIRRALRASTRGTGWCSAGVYPSEPEAASRLREAKAVQRGARTQRIATLNPLSLMAISEPSL